MKHVKSSAAKDALREICSEVKGIPWKEVCPNATDLALDLLGKMIKFDPDARIDAATALKHPFLTEYFEYADEDYPDIEEKFN